MNSFQLTSQINGRKPFINFMRLFFGGNRDEFRPYLHDLVDLLEHPSESVVEGVIYFLGELKVVEAIPGLIKIITEQTHYANEEASTALKSIGWQAVDSLKELLHHPDPWVQNKAVLILGWIGTLPAFHAIREWEVRTNSSD